MKPWSHRAIANQLSPDRAITSSLQKLVLQRFTRRSQLRWLRRCIDHVIPVKHRTLQENYAAHDYVSPNEIRGCLKLNLGIIMQRLT